VAENRVFAVSAGEPSGDAHAARLVKEIQNRAGGARFFGMGGEKLREAGVRIDIPMERVSVVGISEVLSRIGDIYKAYRQFCRMLEKEKPEALIVVDFPDFNFKLLKFAKKHSIPVIYYITPQVWAWRKGRVDFLKKYVDLALVILPFEEEFLRTNGVNAAYVGHPILDREYELVPKKDFIEQLGFVEPYTLVALLPGSRNSEIEAHLPTLAACAEIMSETFSTLKFVIPKAPNVSPRCWQADLPDNCRLVEGRYYEVLAYSDMGAVASGTASLEMALFGLPAVVFYSLNPLTYFLGSKLVKLPFVSLPNIILGEKALSELIQKDFTPERLAGELTELMKAHDEKRKKAFYIKRELKQKLGEHGASQRASDKILEFLKKAKQLF
jgi:lipid-A-disaccharide synthase